MQLFTKTNSRGTQISLAPSPGTALTSQPRVSLSVSASASWRRPACVGFTAEICLLSHLIPGTWNTKHCLASKPEALLTVEGRTQKPISQNKVFLWRSRATERAQRRQVTLITEKHLQQDRTGVNSELDLAEKPSLAGCSLLGVCTRCAMLYLAVLGANENKRSGGSTEAQCARQQQREAQTITPRTDDNNTKHTSSSV